VLKFQELSNELQNKLEAGGHFMVECIHNCGHSEPPVEAENGASRYEGFWQFMFDHPYWLKPGESPYNENGLPPSMPSWCAIGVGNATPPPGVCDKNECS